MNIKTFIKKVLHLKISTDMNNNKELGKTTPMVLSSTAKYIVKTCTQFNPLPVPKAPPCSPQYPIFTSLTNTVIAIKLSALHSFKCMMLTKLCPLV